MSTEEKIFLDSQQSKLMIETLLKLLSNVSKIITEQSELSNQANLIKFHSFTEKIFKLSDIYYDLILNFSKNVIIINFFKNHQQLQLNFINCVIK